MPNLNQLSKAIQAAIFWSDRVIGKPKESTDITTNGEGINIPLMMWRDDNSESEV